jgi:phosphotransferase system HPr-like phosphotransfer protein
MDHRFDPTPGPEIVAVPSGLHARVAAVFAGLGQGVNAAGLKRARLRAIVRLEARSDAELARIGLTREGIAAHVFRDLFG